MAKRPTTDTHEISPGFAWAGVRASGASGLESEPVNPLVSFRCVLLNRYLLEPAELKSTILNATRFMLVRDVLEILAFRILKEQASCSDQLLPVLAGGSSGHGELHAGVQSMCRTRLQYYSSRILAELV